MAARGMVGLAGLLRDILEQSRRGIPAERGVMQGKNYVLVGSMTYPAALAVDLDALDGDAVWCQVTDDGTKAVIVGS